MNESGHISIHTENILPIIKKWLYAEKEVFIRELVSNSVDALHKLQKLGLMGEVPSAVPEPAVVITIDKQAKTITIADTGLGMSADEVKRYINQVAFSGIKDFVDKYQDKDAGQQIIGHFGLGFYSSFMVASKVVIDTKSYRGDPAVHWECDGTTEFKMSESTRSDMGTSITLHIADDSTDLLEAFNLRTVLNKYCAFMKFPVSLVVDGKTEQVNETQPLWSKSPSQLTDKDYLDFFHKLFPGTPDPLFWIHLNLDHPIKLSGVLFFPKLRYELEASQGEVKLFCNQVFVAENMKELIPDFLTLLKGAIDCPDLPLNVSRSALQNEPVVKLVAQHIVKKVADKLAGMAKTESELYQKYWNDIHPFVKYGMMHDHRFAEKMMEHLIYKSTAGGFTGLDPYLERMKDKTGGKIIYASSETGQGSLIRLFREHGLEAIIADTMIDTHFLNFLEYQSGRKWQFERIDADMSKHLLDDTPASQIVDPKDQKNMTERVGDLFRAHMTKPGVKLRFETLKSSKVPAVLLFDETTRRLQEMSRFGGDKAELPEHTLVVNLASDAVKQLAQLGAHASDSKAAMVVQQIYDLALLQHGRFSPDGMQNFLERSAALLADVRPAGPSIIL